MRPCTGFNWAVTVAAGYERYEDDRYNSNAEGIHHGIPSSGDVCPNVWPRDGCDGKYSILVPSTLYPERGSHVPSSCIKFRGTAVWAWERGA